MEKAKTKQKKAAVPHKVAIKKSAQKDSGDYAVRRRDMTIDGAKFTIQGSLQSATTIKGNSIRLLDDLKDVDVLVYMDHHPIDTSHLISIRKLTRNSDAVIAGWLNISPRTLSTYSSTDKVFSKNLGEQVLMLRTVFEKGKRVFGSSDAFDNWLDTTNFFFDGKKPNNFLDTTSGIRFIFDRLTAMEYGDNV